MSGACEVMYCCCNLDCASRNLLCHGSAPGTIRIVGSSTYTRTLRYNFGSGLEDYLIQTGSINVEMYGNYVGPQGEGTLGLGQFNLYGNVTASLTNNYVYSGYWEHWDHSPCTILPPPIVGNYGCGTIFGIPGIPYHSHYTSSYGGDITTPCPVSGGWRIGGRFCDPCLNPGLLCRGYMMNSNNGNIENPSGYLDWQGFAFQGTESASSPPDPNASDVSSSTGTMTIEII